MRSAFSAACPRMVWSNNTVHTMRENAADGLSNTLDNGRRGAIGAGAVSYTHLSSRFPYYMNTFGVHSIHGRAPTLATGLALANPELTLFVVTGDGDGLSIGGNHLLHILRRNVNVNILLFNNRIYGLTKGQYSPTSLPGHKTKSSPMGTVEQSLNPISVALAAEATFVARTVDVQSQHLTEVIRAAVAHRGASFVEIYQNCNIFNDHAWDCLLYTSRCV